MSTPASSAVPLVELQRGGRLECVHLGHAVVCNANGSVVLALGDPRFGTYLRSSAKPFQAATVLASGAAERFGFSEAELALVCASHGAQATHVEGARSILSKCGLTPAALQCGPHLPMHEPSAAALLASGRRPEPIHNNCSGKHAGMLAACRHQGWPIESYLAPDHPLQQANAATLAAFIGCRADELSCRHRRLRRANVLHAIAMDGHRLRTLGNPCTWTSRTGGRGGEGRPCDVRESRASGL